MHIVERTDITVASLPWGAGPPRSAGLHQSTIINTLMAEIDPEAYATDEDPNDVVRVHIGSIVERAIEDALISLMPGVCRPGEFTYDGVIGSPDGLDCARRFLLEYKCTWKSCRQPITDKKFRAWRMQIMGYLKMMGLQDAMLIAFFVNGMYEKGKFGEPLLKVWELSFSQFEIDENWQRLMGYADRKGLRIAA
jgi:hypothetical protein